MSNEEPVTVFVDAKKEIGENEKYSSTNEGVEVQAGVIAVSPEPKSVPSTHPSYISMKQFSVTLIKNITGSGILATPYAIKSMGIIPACAVFFVLAGLNVWCSQLLINVVDYTKRHRSVYPEKQVGNEYAVIMYHVLGSAGYWMFTLLYLIAIWGVQIATLISIDDFLMHLPWPESLFGGSANRRLLFHIVVSVVCIVLVLMKDLKPIIAVASLSIFALILSFLILLLYGMMNNKFAFQVSLLMPLSLSSFFSYMGVPAFSLGYNFSFLSFYSCINPQDKEKVMKTTSYSIGLTTVAEVALPTLAVLYFNSMPGGLTQNVLLMIPSNCVSAILVNTMMFLSTLFSYPIYSPPLNEVLEATIQHKKNGSVFIKDGKRVFLRVAQVVCISMVSFFVTNFVGGFVFTNLSLVIPIALSYVCYRSSLSAKESVYHIVAFLFCFAVMAVSTITSGIKLFSK